MVILHRLKEPVFLKESSNVIEQIERLKELEPKLNAEGKEKLKKK